jgi:hypothetical protein
MLLAYIYRSFTHRVHFLDKASRDLFICAKYLFVEATVSKLASEVAWPFRQLQSLSPLRTHASFGFHLCNFLHTGHRSRKDMFGRDASWIVSVRNPVGTSVWKTGQRITISDITFGPSDGQSFPGRLPLRTE